MATYQKITSLLFKPQGVHNAAVDYSVMDVVTSPDKSRVYFALQNVPAGIALTNEEYWQLQIDLSSSKSAMDEALASFGSYAKEIGMRVKGETAKASGNPVTCLADAGSLLQPVTVLEPKQEGSGDPYPAGGGKNLLPITAKTQTINGVTFTVDNGVITVNGTATANAYLWLCDEFTLQPGTYVMSGIPENFDYNTQGGFTDDNWNINRYGVTTLTEAKKVKPYIVVRNGVTANNVIFKLQLEVGSTPTAFAPYSNIRPFIGYDKLDLNATGKNLLPFPPDSATMAGITFTVNDDGSVHVSGTSTAIVTWGWYEWNDLLMRANTEYVLSGSPVGAPSEAYVAIVNGAASRQGAETKFRYDEDTLVNVRIVVNSGVTVDAVFRPMIRLATDADSTFATPQHKLHTVQIGQTVYGGKFDWLTGKLVANIAKTTLTTSQLNILFVEAASNDKSYYYNITNGIPGTQAGMAAAGRVFGGACDIFRYDAGLYSNKNVEGFTYAGTYVSVRVNASRLVNSSAEALKEYLPDVWEVCYELATPIEIQLSPTIISAADPEQTNTLYGDGRIDVEYVKPLHVSIEERVAAAVAAAMNTEGA